MKLPHSRIRHIECRIGIKSHIGFSNRWAGGSLAGYLEVFGWFFCHSSIRFKDGKTFLLKFVLATILNQASRREDSFEKVSGWIMDKIRLLHASHETSYVINAGWSRCKIDHRHSSEIFDLEMMGIIPWQDSFCVTRNAFQLIAIKWCRGYCISDGFKYEVSITIMAEDFQWTCT